jgi:hypothetical protein
MLSHQIFLVTHLWMGIERYCESKIFSLLQIIMSTQVHPEHTSSPGHTSSPRAHKFTPVYSVGWWCSIISFLCSVLWFVVCLFVLFPLVIVLSVLLPLVIVLSVLLPLVIVLSVFFLWSLCCLSFSFGHCVVCLFPLVIVLSVLLPLVIVLSVLWFTASDYPSGIIKLFLLT